MHTTTTASGYKGHRFPQEIISHAVWLYQERARRFQVWNEVTSLEMAA